MKRIALLAFLASWLILPSLSMAQDQTYDHGEVGVFADYMRLSRPDPAINFIGVGGRIGFNVHPNVSLEAEMAYDFKRNTTSVFDNGITTSFATTRLRPLTALFGPKFQAGTSGPFRAFVTGKVGFVNFANASTLSTAGFGNQVGGITDGDTKFALYPGAGIEAFAGPIGLRLEVGDEIYFADGARNNLKVSFGPHFRF
jgi:hypothetical protein